MFVYWCISQDVLFTLIKLNLISRTNVYKISWYYHRENVGSNLLYFLRKLRESSSKWNCTHGFLKSLTPQSLFDILPIMKPSSNSSQLNLNAPSAAVNKFWLQFWFTLLPVRVVDLTSFLIKICFLTSLWQICRPKEKVH